MLTSLPLDSKERRDLDSTVGLLYSRVLNTWIQLVKKCICTKQLQIYFLIIL